MAYNIDNETIMQVWNDLKKEKEKTKKKKIVQGNCKTLCVFCFWSISKFFIFIFIKFCIMGKNHSAIKGEHYEVFGLEGLN